jgi:5,10-methenyltetrahydrofolate synthetase
MTVPGLRDWWMRTFLVDNLPLGFCGVVRVPVFNNDVLERRADMRARALAAREAVPVSVRAVREAAIAKHLDELFVRLTSPDFPGEAGGTVVPAAAGSLRVLAFCWPFRAEADLRGWVEHWLAADAARVAVLPVVVAKDAPLVFRRWQPGMTLALDRYGIPFPAAGPTLEPDLVLVPLNAFDARGYRLGYGGGYFDRTLVSLRAITVGVGFELGRVADVLPQAHDRALDWLVTEAGVARTGAAANPGVDAQLIFT